MPTQQEQVAQIEAALQWRFFQFIPKLLTPRRESWNEEQHDTDRLSRALAAYVLVRISETDDATAAAAVTDGENDGGIDAVYFDRLRSRLMLVQSKFKRTGSAPSQDETLKTINGIKALVNRQLTLFNAHFQQRFDEIEEALDTPGVMLEVVLVFLGENLGPHATNDMNVLQGELNRVSPCLTWHPDGLSKIYHWLISEQSPQVVSVDVPLESWAFSQTPRKTVYGQISAATLAEMVATYGKSLFERNIRHYLGSIGVNTAIEDTVRNRPRDLFYLNNGLTVLAESITKAAGPLEKCNFGLTNISIVNGAQTAGAIANAALAGAISPEAKLLITIIEIGQNPDDIGKRITRARNHQNVVRAVDFAALDPNQERLCRELSSLGITYHYRPSAEARARRDDAFTLEDAAVALACLSFPVLSSDQVREQRWKPNKELNAVDYVVAAKKQIGSLWQQEGSTIYSELFQANLSGLRMWRMVRIYRFIDQILAASERAENQYHRRMFFRHGRYFIVALVAHHVPVLLNRAELDLSEADKTILSQQTNEISELIYAASISNQGVRGYLAIFRNLTDAQPLADAVLIRLVEQNAQSVAAVTTPPPNVNP